MMTKRGLLLVLSGPSGVGKDTVLSCLLKRRKDCCISISATTRSPRLGERDGIDYFFLTQEEFQAQIHAGEMLEYARYSGNYYGTPAKAVETLREAGTHVILEIEVQGALQIKEKCPDAVFIFVKPPSLESLRQRLANRGTESSESIRSRLEAAERELALADQYDHVLVNNTVEQCCRELDSLITAASNHSLSVTIIK